MTLNQGDDISILSGESLEGTAVQTYFSVVAFYNEESERLDDKELQSWLEMLTDDIQYRIPVRTTTAEGGQHEFLKVCHINDNYWRLKKRVDRLYTEHAWAERPLTRTRHHVSNIRVVGETDDRIEVKSNLLLFLNRGVSPDHDLLSGERHDVLKRENGTLKLDSRTVYLDQATLPLDKLSVFV